MAIYTVELRKIDRFQFITIEADSWEHAITVAEKRYQEGPLSADGINVMFESEAVITDERGCEITCRRT